MFGQVSKDVYISVFEMLIRGNSSRGANEGTQFFAESLKRTMLQKGCLGENDSLIIEKLKRAFKYETIDVNILCSALSQNFNASDVDMDISNDPQIRKN